MADSMLRTTSPNRRALLFAVEAMLSVAGTLMSVAIFFYMQDRFHWQAAQNFRLATAQGVVYIFGALSAGKLAARFSRERWLIIAYALLMFIDLAAGLVASEMLVVALMLVHQLVIGATWPALESLCIAGADPHAMSRRVGVYNIVWSAAGAAAVALGGTIIKYFGPGYFLVGAAMQLGAVILMLLYGHDYFIETQAHEEPPPELQRRRVLALWLSRVAMPATYVVVYGLAATMPDLPTLQHLGTAGRTAVSSAWLVGRVIAFMLFGATVFWHTRPRLMLIASILMVPAFIGIVVRPSELFGAAVTSWDLPMMIAWQLALGLLIGAIYSASLYFGMVLSQGSTEHGGYHEALIGLGSVLGPGAGAIAATIDPGDLRASVAAVTSIVCLTAALTVVVSYLAERRTS